MRDLNSIVITGKADVNWEENPTKFWVKNRIDTRTKSEIQVFTVEVKGTYLPKICREGIKTGMQVRVVGSYETDHILADHVEVVE